MPLRAALCARGDGAAHVWDAMNRQGDERNLTSGSPPSVAQVMKTALQVARRGQVARALEMLSSRRSRGQLSHAESASLRHSAARVLLDDGRAKSAVAELVEALRINAHNPDTLLLLAESLIACGEDHRARDILARAAIAGADEDTLEVLNERLRCAEAEGPRTDPVDSIHDERFDPAMATLRVALRDAWAGLDPINPDATTSDAPAPYSAASQPRDARWDKDSFTDTVPSGDTPALNHAPAPEPDHDPTPDHAGFDPPTQNIVAGQTLNRDELLLLSDPELDEPWELTRSGISDIEADVPTAPRRELPDLHGQHTADMSATRPRAWSIGDPGRAGTSAARPLAFSPDEDTITGGFNGVSGDVFNGLDKQVRRRLTQNSRVSVSMLALKPEALRAAQQPPPQDDVWQTPTPRSPRLPPLGPPPPYQRQRGPVHVADAPTETPATPRRDPAQATKVALEKINTPPNSLDLKAPSSPQRAADAPSHADWSLSSAPASTTPPVALRHKHNLHALKALAHSVAKAPPEPTSPPQGDAFMEPTTPSQRMPDIAALRPPRKRHSKAFKDPHKQIVTPPLKDLAKDILRLGPEDATSDAIADKHLIQPRHRAKTPPGEAPKPPRLPPERRHSQALREESANPGVPSLSMLPIGLAPPPSALADLSQPQAPASSSDTPATSTPSAKAETPRAETPEPTQTPHRPDTPSPSKGGASPAATESPRQKRPGARLRQPDLLEKLERAARHQKNSASQTPAKAKPRARSAARRRSQKGPRLPLVLSGALVVLLTLIVVGGIFFIYPALHYRAVTNTIDTHVAMAIEEQQQDTSQNLQRAANHLKAATDAQGPVGALNGAIEGYLALIGVDGHVTRRREASARMADVLAQLETRFALTLEPGAASLLETFSPQTQPIHASMARARLDISQQRYKQALEQLDRHNGLQHAADIETLRGIAKARDGQSAEAREHFGKARHLDPKHVRSRLELGRLLVDLKDDEALQHLNDVLRRLCREHPEALTLRARHAVNTQDGLAQARDDLARLLGPMKTRLTPVERAHANIVMARLDRLQGHSEAALKSLDSAMKEVPTSGEAAALRIDVLLDEDRRDDARAAIDQHRETLKADPSLARLEGKLAVLDGRLEEALSHFNALSPQDGEGLAIKGHALLALDRLQDAEATFEAASRTPDPAGLMALTMLRASQGRNDMMRRLEDDAKDKDSAAAQWRLGWALLHMDRPKDALEYLRRSVAVDPDGRFRMRMPPSQTLCEAYRALQDRARATQSCQRARQRRPSLLTSYVILAELATEDGDHSSALKIWKDALTQRPSHPPLLEGLTHTQILLGRFDEAAKHLDDLLNDAPENPRLLFLQGLLEYRRHRHSQAVGYFQRILKDTEDLTELRVLLSWSLLKLKRTKDAQPHINALLKRRQPPADALVINGELLRLRGDWRRAIQYASRGMRLLRRARAPEAEIARARTVLAQAHELNRGLTHPPVEQELERAASLNYAPALYHLARVRSAQKRHDDALNLLARAVALDQHYCPAVNAMRQEARQQRKDVNIAEDTLKQCQPR